MWHIDTMEYYATALKNKIMINGEKNYPDEITQI